VRHAHQEPASVIPRRSDRLAAKSVFRDPNPEKQAKRVLVHKWECRPANGVSSTPDDKITEKFHVAFAESVVDYKWEAINELLHYQGPRLDVAVELLC
jgi:hypothetical protein